jgi:hypothetical protein
MKQLFIFALSVLIFTTSSSFGLLESSTVMHSKYHNKRDSLRVNSSNSKLIQATLPTKKEAEKTEQNQLTKSLIQWLANGVKNMVECLSDAIIHISKTILSSIFHFFTSSLNIKMNF